MPRVRKPIPEGLEDILEDLPEETVVPNDLFTPDPAPNLDDVPAGEEVEEETPIQETRLIRGPSAFGSCVHTVVTY